MTRTFKHVISLGAGCQTRWHLQRFLIKKYGEDRSVSYFFDWLWRRAPHDAIHDWLVDDLALNATSWKLELAGENWEVMAEKYKYFFPHDFHFSAAQNKASCEKEMHEMMPDFTSKYQFLQNRTLGALRSNSPLAFLLGDEITKPQFLKLDALLRDKFEIKDYVLFNFPRARASKEAPYFHERLVTIPVEFLPWPGHAESWANAFRALDLDFEA